MIDKIIVELFNCTEVLLDEISKREFKQKDIAQTYALALKSNEKTDWVKINKAIIEQWSISGLARIKEMAWSGN